MGNGLNGYALTKSWFDYVLDNPGLINASHTSLYFVLIEINNRLDWREKFSITSSECMALMPCSSRTTYSKCLKDLVDWGFVNIVLKSSNQYSANVISLNKNYSSISIANEQTDNQLSDKAIKQPMDQQLNYSQTTKPLKPKTNKLSNSKEAQLDKIKYKAKESFENCKCDFSNDFKNIWLKLLQEPKWIKKSQTAINTSLEGLMKYDEVFSIELVKSAISGNWQGVVFADTDIKYSTYLTAKNKSRLFTSTDRQQRVEEVRQLRIDNQQSIVERLQKYTTSDQVNFSANKNINRQQRIDEVANLGSLAKQIIASSGLTSETGCTD